ncbi:MAG: peptidase U32 family protein [Bacteroidota bacterium]|nr:peptidase U32 family protein [Bacteroidota bacterium]
MKAELLLPAGSIEAFFAAVEGGADAVYLGLSNFNARARASNFNISQFGLLLKEAKKNNVKVYLTLNTVIKNEELPELLDLLFFLSKSSVSAVIIQDWGVFYLIKKYFPKIKIHASTQMGNHNSASAIFSQNHGFERVILARELQLSELQQIKNKSNIQLEVFIHGALCYSFSGMCLFSSYIGGHGANRGFCTQPCRRYYNSKNKKSTPFSLKDQQQLEFISDLSKIGISSLKVEGRMKSAEYVYKIAKAYRLILDHPDKFEEAKELLEMDLSREKTSFFIGKDVGNAITSNPATGKLVGKVIKVANDSFLFNSEIELQKGNRIRIHSAKGDARGAVKLKTFTTSQSDVVTVWQNNHKAQKGDLVFLSELRDKKFVSKLSDNQQSNFPKLASSKKNEILKQLNKPSKRGKQELFIRIDSLKWLRKIWIKNIDKIIINLPKREWLELDATKSFIQKNAHKFIIELPKFISENDIVFYERLCQSFVKNNLKSFMISHISQKEILPKKCTVFTNENVYVFNNASKAFLLDENIKDYIYPLENEEDNLFKSNDRNGIIPLYFHPQLFLSRVPIKVQDDELIDDRNEKVQKQIKDGLTIITPNQAVSFLQFRKELEKKGFHKWLLDFSTINPSQNVFNTIVKRFQNSQQLQPTTTFNFKKGLK